MLEKVFSTSLNVLRRMQVHSYGQIMLKWILRGLRKCSYKQGVLIKQVKFRE